MMQKVFIVEDEPYVRDEIKYMLESYQELCVVGEADNAFDAIAEIVSLKPDVVFLDINLGSVDGVTLAKKINELALGIKLVFITAFETYAIEGFELNAVDYVLKPFSEQRLKKTVERIQQENPAPAPESTPSSEPAATEYEPSFNRAGQFITVLTGPISGIYYPIGGAFYQLCDSLGYKSNATATGATAENINSLLAGDGEMAIAMSDAVIQAYEAYGAFEGKEPATDLRAIMGLWPNVCQIVTTADSGITSFEDMKGKRVGVGAPNSGVELNARMMFEAHDMTYDDCKVDYLSYGKAIDQMKNDMCDVAFVTSGLGNATIQELGIDKEIVFIPVEGAARDKLISKYPFYVEFTIPAEAYGTANDTQTVAVMNIMIVHQNLPAEVVYDLLYNIYSDEGLALIQGSHAQAAEHIKLDTALRGVKGTVVPLHDGAVQFYEEKGLL